MPLPVQEGSYAPIACPPILQVLAVVLAGWLNRQQQRVLEYSRKRIAS